MILLDMLQKHRLGAKTVPLGAVFLHALSQMVYRHSKILKQANCI